MKGELYNYKGQMMTQADISKLEGINRSTLADWYKKTHDMVLAVEGAKKSLAQRNISYYDEVLSLKAISEREEIKFESLKKFYDQTNDIYEAVRLTKEAQLKRNGSILYNGKMMSMSAIALETGLERNALTRYFEQTGDIYKSIELAKIAKDKQHGIIEYKGKVMSITAIANLEGIKRDTLKEYYELYGNIEKAVFITKESQLKRKQALLRGKKASYEELARQFDISVIELDRMINSGISPENLKKKSKKGVSSESQLKYDEESLYKYCLDHSYNYWVINYLIKTYGKTPEEAVKAYVANGQQLPIKWIYEKYGLLFKHLTLNFGLDSNRIIKIMKDNNCGIEEAIKKLIFVSKNNDNDFKIAEINWMEELYDFIKDIPTEEYLDVKDTFYITDREEKFIKGKSSLIERINRQLLLYEFAIIIDEWPIEEITEMMDLYDLTEEEKVCVILDLYSPFKNMVIDPTNDHKNRNEAIRSIITDSTITNESIIQNENLSEVDKKEIIKKKMVLAQLIASAKKTNGSSLK